MNNLMFVDEGSNQLKTEYNSGMWILFLVANIHNILNFAAVYLDMMNNLDMFQNLVDNGSISPNSLNMNNEEQLNNFNLWLAQLTESIEGGASASANPTSNASYDYAAVQQQQPAPAPQQTNYADMLLQFNANLPMSDTSLYPTASNPEQDMYVRSQPLMQTSTLDYNPSTPSKLYGDYSMPMMDTTSTTYNYATELPPPQMNGMRHHYANVPGIVNNNNYFTPDLRTTQNLGSSKDGVKYKPKSPVDAESKEEKAAEAFKPVKPDTLIESKKNVTTMMNVFASAADDSSPKKPSSSSSSSSSVASSETNKQPQQSRAKKSPVSKDVLDLLVSDMSDLAIEKEAQTTQQELYPAADRSKLEKHQQLLKNLSQWVNKNFKDQQQQKQQKSVGTISSPSPSSVQVQ